MKKKLKTLLLFVSLVFLHTAVFPHYQWIIADPAGRDTLKIRIGSGHHFPKSGMLLKKEMIGDIRISGGNLVPVEFQKSGREWTGFLKGTVTENGVVEFAVRRKGFKSPVFSGKCVLPGTYKDKFPRELINGEGVEIVPHSILRETGLHRIRLMVFRDGKPVSARVTVIQEKGRPVYLNSDSESGCVVDLKKRGWVLASAHLRGSSASVTFYIGE